LSFRVSLNKNDDHLKSWDCFDRCLQIETTKSTLADLSVDVTGTEVEIGLLNSLGKSHRFLSVKTIDCTVLCSIGTYVYIFI
jgi:hypothetical protein